MERREYEERLILQTEERIEFAKKHHFSHFQRFAEQAFESLLIAHATAPETPIAILLPETMKIKETAEMV